MDRPLSHEFHPATGLHYNKLNAPVRSYVDNLRAQVYEVFKKYDVTNMTEFIAKMKKIEVPDRQKVIKLMGAIEIAYKRNETPGVVAVEEARETLGEKNVLGPQEIENCFGFKPDEVPAIPFSQEDLERAKDLNQFLILRIDKDSDGRPMSLETINDQLAFEWMQTDKGAVLHNWRWFRDRLGDERYRKEAVRPGWALVSKELVALSTQKHYLGQTDLLVNYITQEIFKDRNLPEVYQQAIQEFIIQQAYLKTLMSSDWEEYAKRLTDLQITKLCRGTDQEIIYDLALYYDVNDVRLLPNTYAASASLMNDGLSYIGNFGDDGVNFGSGSPDETIGAMFSRRA